MMDRPGKRPVGAARVTACAAWFLGMPALALIATVGLAQSPPKRVSWNGDPTAPPFGGVWRLVDASTSPGKSKEGWTPWPPPLRSAFATRWRKEVADAKAGTRTDDPVMSCQPPGMPRFITGDRGPLLIIQSHDRVTLYRDGMGPRRAWLDGRTLPEKKDLEEFYSGNTIGRYERKDMILESMGFKDQPIDSTGVPHSDQLKIVERYHRIDDATLRVTVTLTDPIAYSRPITSTVTYKAVGDPLWEPREFICTPKSDYHPEMYVR